MNKEQLQKENDELKAHVERLRESLDAVIKKCVIYGTYCFDGYAEIQDIAVHVYNETPAQSLRHIESRVEEETIERIRSRLSEHGITTTGKPAADLCVRTIQRKYKEQSDED